MKESEPTQGPPVFNLNAYSPAEIQDAIERVGVTKADMPLLASFTLAVVAGGSIGLGALYFTVVASDPTLGFAATRLLGGLVFSLGLTLIIVAGSELFTGNILIVMGWASRRIATRKVLRNWAVVYCGNFVGALGLVGLVLLSRHLDWNGGLVRRSILDTAIVKISPDILTLFFRGVLCNLLVCLAIWIAYAGRSVTDKIVGTILPISCFVAAGFEHCIANMYFLPLAWLSVELGGAPQGFDASAITLAGIGRNLVAVTLGNIVGGAGLVGFVFWAIYRKGLRPR